MKRKDFMKTTAGLLSLMAVPTSLAMKKPLKSNLVHKGVDHSTHLGPINLDCPRNEECSDKWEATTCPKCLGTSMYPHIAKKRGLSRIILGTVDYKDSPYSDSELKEMDEEDRVFFQNIRTMINGIPQQQVTSNGGIYIKSVNEAFKIIENQDFAVGRMVIHPSMIEPMHKTCGKCCMDICCQKILLEKSMLVAYMWTAGVHTTDLINENEMYLFPWGEHLTDSFNNLHYNRISKINIT